ncbi:hypothetical protein [Pseudomonas sp. TH15]|uniref:hypothetical protein n=1 Tax=Pseudomonas sp. TH15 TaxID=2796381 RepID=UPI00191162C5|nr:hypothetical protein [Pseudomonas sp. TH15]MBK5511397.1 hypothetical protein [Pseudomonas sp. TH15]
MLAIVMMRKNPLQFQPENTATKGHRAMAAPDQPVKMANKVSVSGCHASVSMTKYDQMDHAKIVWPEAVPDMNISENTG